MVKITPEEFVEKHARRLKGAIEDMRRGVEKVDVAPSKKAVEKEAKFKTRLVESIDKGIWRERLGKVTLEEWKEKMIEKGLPRVSGGIDAASDKMYEFASQLLPYVSSTVEKIAKLPDITLEDNINRMTTFIREMSKFKKK